MKKYSLLKILGITFLVVVGLTWIIPAGNYSSGVFTSGSTSPLGLMDLIRLPLSTFSNLIHYAMVFLLIGGLYGVINKTGVYHNLVDSVVEKFKGKENIFLIITMLFFIIFTSLTGLIYVLFILVPFFAAVLILMHYNKVTALMATIGSIFIGIMGSTYSFDINGYINYYFSLDINSEILIKIIFLAIISALSILFVTRNAKININKNESKDEKVVIPLFDKGSKTKKNYLSLVIIMIIAIVILMVGMYNWQYTFNITFFTDSYNSLMNLTAGDYPIMKNIIGSINPLGNWSIYELSMIIVITSMLIGWVYSIKFNQFIDGFIRGIKEMLPTAFYVVMANIVFVILASSTTGGNIFFTISDFFFKMSDNLNIVTMSIVSAIGSFFYSNFNNFFNALGPNIAAIYTDTTLYQIIAMIIRVMYGLVMFIAPTSLLLIGGLSYLDVSYKEWLKYIWKLLIEIFVIAIVIIIIMVMFV